MTDKTKFFIIEIIIYNNFFPFSISFCYL